MFKEIRGYNLAPDFEGVVVNVSVMVVTNKGTHESDLSQSYPFAKSVVFTQLDLAAHANRVLQLAIEEAQKRGIL